MSAPVFYSYTVQGERMSAAEVAGAFIDGSADAPESYDEVYAFVSDLHDAHPDAFTDADFVPMIHAICEHYGIAL